MREPMLNKEQRKSEQSAQHCESHSRPSLVRMNCRSAGVKVGTRILNASELLAKILAKLMQSQAIVRGLDTTSVRSRYRLFALQAIVAFGNEIRRRALLAILFLPSAEGLSRLPNRTTMSAVYISSSSYSRVWSSEHSLQ
jgi:hypothetical protein